MDKDPDQEPSFIVYVFRSGLAKHLMVSMRTSGYICFPAVVFETMIQVLRTQILDGTLDPRLHLTTAKLIYDKMSETYAETLKNIPDHRVVLRRPGRSDPSSKPALF